jgi:hypothetical protein
MGFLLFNTVVFLSSLALTYTTFSNSALILSLPLSVGLLVGLGVLMVVLNLYDSIKNFVVIGMLLSAKGNTDED